MPIGHCLSPGKGVLVLEAARSSVFIHTWMDPGFGEGNEQLRGLLPSPAQPCLGVSVPFGGDPASLGWGKARDFRGGD